jgi:hypothetical protein
VFENVENGASVKAAARGSGADGHFVATVRLPVAGLWRWRVTLRDLIVETPPAYVAVADASGVVPAWDPARTLPLIDRAVSDAKAEMTSDFGARLEALEAELAGTQSKVVGVDSQVTRATENQAELEAAVAALQGAPPAEAQVDGALPALALVAVGALAGAIAGFGAAYLGRGMAGRTRGAPPAGEVPTGYASPTR